MFQWCVFCCGFKNGYKKDMHSKTQWIECSKDDKMMTLIINKLGGGGEDILTLMIE